MTCRGCSRCRVLCRDYFNDSRNKDMFQSYKVVREEWNQHMPAMHFLDLYESYILDREGEAGELEWLPLSKFPKPDTSVLVDKHPEVYQLMKGGPLTQLIASSNRHFSSQYVCFRRSCQRVVSCGRF